MSRAIVCWELAQSGAGKFLVMFGSHQVEAEIAKNGEECEKSIKMEDPSVPR